MKRSHDVRPRAFGPARSAALAVALAWLSAGCVDVPSRMMEGDPIDDAAVDPPDVPWQPDGMPAQEPPEDSDDPGADGLDGGSPDVIADGFDGRPDGAGPGPYQPPRRIRFAETDPVRCPDGGVLVPGIAQCLIFDRVPDLPGMRSDAASAAVGERVVVVGGRDFERPARSETWVFDGQAWVDGPPLPVPAAGSRAVAVDGAVWVVGGFGAAGAETAAQAVDPDGGAMLVGRLSARREVGFTAHRLGDGRVVVVGGEGRDGAGAEVVDPVAEMVLGRMGVPRSQHVAAVAADGALWVIGGLDRDGQVRFAPEVLDPGSGAWRSVPGPAGWSMADGAAAPSGATVVFAGGYGVDGRVTGRAGTYDPEAQSWQALGELNVPQAELEMAPIGADGALLVVGGGALEVFDPVDGGFFLISRDNPFARTDAAITPVGEAVLVIGGQDEGRVLTHGFLARLEAALPPMDPPDEGEEEEQQNADERFP